MEKKTIVINDNCQNRIKPKLIRDVKTEALLVFTRTALERFFKKIDDDEVELFINSKEDTTYVYNTLRVLLTELQKYIVNVEYLLELIKFTKQNPTSMELKKLAKYEEPLIVYYDAMARRMEHHFPSKTSVMPEFIVICCLSNWLLEEEKSSSLFPFVQNIDCLGLIEKFEQYSKNAPEDKRLVISNMHRVSLDIIETLKKTKYKFNKERSAKTRKKK